MERFSTSVKLRYNKLKKIRKIKIIISSSVSLTVTILMRSQTELCEANLSSRLKSSRILLYTDTLNPLMTRSSSNTMR